MRDSKKLILTFNSIWVCLLSSVLASALSSCTNSTLPSSRSATTSSTPTAIPSPTATLEISSVNLISTTSFNFSFNTSSASRISDHCDLSGSKPCRCKYIWNEQNTASGINTNIPREVYTSPTLIQSSLVSCPTPPLYNTQEIAPGTTLSLSIIPGGLSSTFVTNIKTYKKLISASSAGSFQDDEGRDYDDILRYTCYDQAGQAGLITNRSNPNLLGFDANIETLFANQLCHPDDPADFSDPRCSHLRNYGKSADSYYFNLYIRSGVKGTIKPGNQRYVCPKVLEAIDGSSTLPNYYPLDSSFSLSINMSGKFNVPVDAKIRTANSNDPQSNSHTECLSSGSTTATDTELQRGCLGYAARTESDGSCGSITLKDGTRKQMYRLRRYLTIYPTHFTSKGKAIEEAKSRDTIYVLDRPVYTDPLDATKFATMLGPKPCNFAYFDKMAVTGGGVTRSYRSTNDLAWEGKNPNGFKFPNKDYISNTFIDSYDFNKVPSCSSNMMLFNENSQLFSLGTIHSSNTDPTSNMTDLQIRPMTAWSPNYVEDTEFKACAPVPNTIKDPPLHFARDTVSNPNRNVAYCAMVYPTQNPYAQFKSVEKVKEAGTTLTYTSPVSLNSSSAPCTATSSSVFVSKNIWTSTFNTQYGSTSGTGTLDHIGGSAPNTCDRTVILSTPNELNVTFPLQAAPVDVERMLKNNSAYNCTLTWNKDNTSDARIGSVTPKSCCSNFVQTNNLITSPTEAHLEPTAGTAPSVCSTTTDY